MHSCLKDLALRGCQGNLILHGNPQMFCLPAVHTKVGKFPTTQLSSCHTDASTYVSFSNVTTSPLILLLPKDTLYRKLKIELLQILRHSHLSISANANENFISCSAFLN